MDSKQPKSVLPQRQIKSRVVELIRSIDKIAAYGEQRNGEEDNHDWTRIWRVEEGGSMDTSGVSSYNAIFAYFCDKNKLS